MSGVHPPPPPPPPPGFQSPVSSLSSMASMTNMGLPSMANFHQGMSNLHGMSGFNHPSYTHGHSSQHVGHQTPYAQGMEYSHLAGGSHLGATPLSAVPSGAPSTPGYPSQTPSTPALTPPAYDRRGDGGAGRDPTVPHMRGTPGAELGETLPSSTSFSSSSSAPLSSPSSSAVAAAATPSSSSFLSFSALSSSGTSSSPRAGLLSSTSDGNLPSQDSASSALAGLPVKYPTGHNLSSPYASRDTSSMIMDTTAYHMSGRMSDTSAMYPSPTKDTSSSSSSSSLHHHHQSLREEEPVGLYSKEGLHQMAVEDDTAEGIYNKDSNMGARNGGAGEGASEAHEVYSNKDISSSSAYGMRSGVEASDVYSNNYHHQSSKHSFLTTFKDANGSGSTTGYTRNDSSTPLGGDPMREGSVPMYNHNHMQHPQQQQQHNNNSNGRDSSLYGPADYNSSSISNASTAGGGSSHYQWGNISSSAGCRLDNGQALRGGATGYSNTLSGGAVVKQQPMSPAGSTGSLQSMSPPSSSDQSPYPGVGRSGIGAGLAGESVDLSVTGE